MQPKYSNKKQLILDAVGKVIVRERNKMGKSQRLFADEFDIQRSMICRLESAQNEPNLLSVWKIANAFGMKASAFLKLVENELGDDCSLIDE